MPSDLQSLHDPGGKIRTALPEGMRGSAGLSSCGRYRHFLFRYWDEAVARDSDEPYVLWIGLNPSTATAEVNDPTITREIGFARRLGFKAMFKCNVFDYRATNPKALAGAPARSPLNLETVLRVAGGARFIIAAWGSVPKPLMWGVRDVRQALKGKELWCLGFTKEGHPRHPLYVAGDAELRRWN